MSFVQYILMNEKNLQTIEQVIIHTHSKDSKVKRLREVHSNLNFMRCYFTQILK